MGNLLRLKTALRTYGHTLPLKDGTVRPGSCALDFEEVPVIVHAFRRMVRGLEFDVSEMALTTYICARAHGKPFTAIPVFPMRGLHHGAIVYNACSGIRTPKDLEGRRVGVNRGYTVTTGVWARGILQHEYGVDLRRIRWVRSGDEHVAEYRHPDNVEPMEEGRQLQDLLEAGELPAAVGLEVRSEVVRPLIPDAREAALRALKEGGLYPINHTVVIRDDLLAARPGLAADLFSAFARAKQVYLERLRAGGDLSEGDRLYREVMDLTGDPLPYGVEPNRPMLERLLAHCLEQGIIDRPVAAEQLFPEATRSLVA